MEGNETVKMSKMNDNNLKNENTEEFDGDDHHFDEKTSLFAPHNSADDFDSESEAPGAKTKTAEIDRSLYMENTLSIFSATLHVIKGNLGIGLLGLPFAVMNAGLVVGPLMIILTGLVVLHCMHLLVESSHTFCDRNKEISLGYAEVAEMAIGLYFPGRKSLGGLLVNTFLLITQLGFCCVYFIFVGESFKQIFAAVIVMDVKVWVAIFLLPVILLSFIRTLKVMTIISGISNVLYVTGLFCLLVYAVHTVKDPSTLPNFVGFGSLPLSFGSIVFAFEAIGIVLPVENMMALPGKFRVVINAAMCLVLLSSTLLGTLGFLSCGMKCHGSFTLDLPPTMFGDIMKLVFAIAILFTYFIQFYVPITIILPPLKEKVDEKYHTILDYGVRAALVSFTAILAVSIPQLGHMISLVGAFGSASLAITFPALIHLAVLHHGKKLDKMTLFKDALIVFVGIFGTIAGVFVSVVDIIWSFQHGDEFAHHYRHLHHANSTITLHDSIV